MRFRVVSRIARWEVTTGASGFNRRAILLICVSIVLLAVLVPLTLSVGGSPESGIYGAGVGVESAFHEPLHGDPKFVVEEPDVNRFNRGDLEVLIADGTIHIRDTQKGRAAGAALESALESYNNQMLQQESDQRAAFPVSVRLRYVDRETDIAVAPADQGSTTEDGPDPTPQPIGDSNGQEHTDVTTPTHEETPDGTTLGVPSFGMSTALLGQTSGSPTDITPPFPFISLVLAFAFVVPMNFVIQAYASSILHERQNRRGELLLVAPIARHEIVAGKTLPYFLVMLAIAISTAVVLGGGLPSVVAVTPIAVLFLSCAFVGAVLARSQKELTFVLVTVSVIVTTYVFVPAIFTQIHPIAAISPLTLVVRDLEGIRISLSSYVFSTGPMFLTGFVLFGFGLGMFREEDLFAQRTLPAKTLDALATHIRRPSHAAVMSVLTLPFVFVFELLAVAILFVVPLSIGIPALLVIIGIIEEAAKSIHLYAGFERGRYPRTLKPAVIVGAWSGFGFFLGEKLMIGAQLVGLPDLELGWAAFEVTAGTGGTTGVVLVILIAAPLVLHIATAIISSVGAMASGRKYLGGFLFAVSVHVLYNVVVVTAVV